MVMRYSKFADLNRRTDQSANDITHFFSRHFANPVAYFFYRLGFTPNQTTLVFILIGVCGGILALFGYALSAYICWRMHIIVDMADGGVARATQKFSQLGDTLDKVGHHVIYPAYWLGYLTSIGAVETYPLMALTVFAVSSSQWTSKHLFREKANRPQARSHVKRIVANMFGMEGFVLLSAVQIAFEPFSLMGLLCWFILSNFALLIWKIKSLIELDQLS